MKRIMGADQSAIAVAAKAVTIAVDDADRVSGLLQVPPRARACYVMAHGAGAGMTHSFMANFAIDLAERGIATLRYQFPSSTALTDEFPGAGHAPGRPPHAQLGSVAPRDLPTNLRLVKYVRATGRKLAADVVIAAATDVELLRTSSWRPQMGGWSRMGNAVLSGVLACVVGFGSSSVVASTSTTEITDMWFNPAESGWGVNIILQNNVAFMTFFVYDTNQNPVWYTAELRHQGSFVWSGPLYATRGPWFGGPFPSASTTIRQAGTASFSIPSNYNQATLTYVVDGVSVVKSLQRQTWTFEDYSGQYAGGFSIRATGCVPSSQNGIQEVVGYVGVTQSGTSISISMSASTMSCNFSGTYSQQGKLGRVDGTYSCTDGTQGNFIVFDMTPTVSGFNGRAVGQNQICQWSGYVGGIRRAP